MAGRGAEVSRPQASKSLYTGSTEFNNKTHIKRQIIRAFKIQPNMTSPKLKDFIGPLPSMFPLTQFLKHLELLIFNQKSGKPFFIYV